MREVERQNAKRSKTAEPVTSAPSTAVAGERRPKTPSESYKEILVGWNFIFSIGIVHANLVAL